MPTVYKYKPIIEEGPFGSIKNFKNTEENEIQIIGKVDDTYYISIPDTIQFPEQDSELVFTEETDREFLKTLQKPKLEKETFRTTLELEVGDAQDLLADCMKMCEFALVLAARVSKEVLTGTPMSEPTRTNYTDRVSSFVDALDSGLVKLRSDTEDPVDMMNRIMTRYTKINHLYETSYKAKIDELL